MVYMYHSFLVRGELLLYSHHHPPILETQAVIFLLFTPAISWNWWMSISFLTEKINSPRLWQEKLNSRPLPAAVRTVGISLPRWKCLIPVTHHQYCKAESHSANFYWNLLCSRHCSRHFHSWSHRNHCMYNTPIFSYFADKKLRLNV